MANSWKRRTAVYLVTTPPGWSPRSIWSLPPTFLSARLHSKNLWVQDAIGLARALNKAAIERFFENRVVDERTDEWAEEWAIVVPCLRGAKTHTPPLWDRLFCGGDDDE